MDESGRGCPRQRPSAARRAASSRALFVEKSDASGACRGDWCTGCSRRGAWPGWHPFRAAHREEDLVCRDVLSGKDPSLAVARDSHSELLESDALRFAPVLERRAGRHLRHASLAGMPDSSPTVTTCIAYQWRAHGLPRVPRTCPQLPSDVRTVRGSRLALLGRAVRCAPFVSARQRRVQFRVTAINGHEGL